VIDQPYTSLVDDSVTINRIARFEYRLDGGPWFALPASDGAFDSSAEDVSATLPLYDGRYKVDLRALNAVGAASPIVSAAVVVSGVGAAPAYAVAAPAITGTDTITVKLSAPYGTLAQISEDPLFGAANWFVAGSSARLPLAKGDGTHTLYVRFRDSAGLESIPFARTVLLDSTPPTGRAIRHAGSAPWLEIQAEDSGAGLSALQVEVGNGLAAAWQPYQSSLPLPPTSDPVSVRLRDGAGNVSAPLVVFTSGPVYLPMANR
jgi:hypothetical protein